MSLLLLVLLLGVPHVSPNTHHTETVKGTHCVLYVIDQHADGEFLLSDPYCFDSGEAAEMFSKSSIERDFVERRGTLPASIQSEFSNFTLGTHYDGLNGNGSSVSIVGSSCTGGYWNTGATWANRISSSFNGCARLAHWDLPAKSGGHENTYGVGTTDNLSAYNDRAESVSYHSS